MHAGSAAANQQTEESQSEPTFQTIWNARKVETVLVALIRSKVCLKVSPVPRARDVVENNFPKMTRKPSSWLIFLTSTIDNI